MSQQEASNDYTQASSFAQNDLDESTSTTDLETNRNTKPFKPVEQAYLKAFIKITRQRTIMGQNLKMICSILLQSTLEWKERSTWHLTGLNQMVTLRVFIIS